MLQLDWKTISATMKKSAWVRYNIRYDMSHLVITRMMCRSRISWSTIIYTPSKKVSFFFLWFNINIYNFKSVDQVNYKIRVRSYSFFQADLKKIQYFTQERFLNYVPSKQVYAHSWLRVEKIQESDWSKFFILKN